MEEIIFQFCSERHLTHFHHRRHYMNFISSHFTSLFIYIRELQSWEAEKPDALKWNFMVLLFHCCCRCCAPVKLLTDLSWKYFKENLHPLPSSPEKKLYDAMWGGKNHIAMRCQTAPAQDICFLEIRESRIMGGWENNQAMVNQCQKLFLSLRRALKFKF